MKQPSAQRAQRIFISDCEGPISKNDNAYELTSYFVLDGSRLFTLISRYDDVLADIVKRPGYKAGDTLKLILPFLKAYGVTNKDIEEYSARNVLLVPEAKDSLGFIKEFMPTFIVSTSYERYMKALCSVIDFPFENVYCTKLNLDKYEISKKEIARIKKLREEMIAMPIPEIPKNAKSLSDFSSEHKAVLRRLDEIFWNEISKLKIGSILDEVNPVGGKEKAEAIKSIVARLGSSLQKVMYVGDSITDVEAFRLVRQGGGLTLAFNGNSFAVREIEVAVLSENALTTAVIADVFNRFGKDQALTVVKEWKRTKVEKLDLHLPLKDSFLKRFERKFPRVELVTSENMERLMQESSSFRKSVRGEAIGKLG
jgi:energy-converting hydrogenase A subunit R